MPVKVRCRGCKQVLNAPDRARGKAIKCPNCEELVRVPAGDGQSSDRPKTPPRKKRPQQQKGPSDDLANLDLRHAEDRQSRVCPKCGADVDEEDLDCSECGVDLATGELSIRAQREKGLIGPDQSEFYGRAWSDSARFTWDNKHLVLKTGFYWTILILLLGANLSMLGWILTSYPEKWPLILFFGSFSFLFWAGTFGWYWRLAIEVIQITLRKKKTIKQVPFDLYQALALGCKVVIWPVIFMIPVMAVSMIFLIPMAFVGSLVLGSLGNFMIGMIALGIYCLPVIVFPVAMVHMSMRYTYKAWLPTEMVKVWAKSIGASLYWLMIFIVVNLPIIGILIALLLLSPFIASFFDGTLRNWSTWIMGQIWESNVVGGFVFHCVRLMLVGFFAFLLVAPICFLAAIPAVFTMRANGLLAFYRKDKLELIREKKKFEPAGFWVRYLAYMIDYLLIPLTSILVFKNRLAMIAIWAHNASIFVFLMFLAPKLGDGAFYLYVGTTAPLLNGWLYFALSEGSAEQGTIGKHAFGMVVLTEKGMKQLTLKQATVRFFAKNIVSAMPFGIGFIFAAFTPKNQGLHDIIAKTVVVFKGDDETTQ